MKMVVLMLYDPCKKTICIKRERLSICIEGLNLHTLRPDDIMVHSGNGKTSFLIRACLYACLDNFRIDEDQRVFLRDPYYEYLLRNTYLRPCEANPIRFLQGLKHSIRKHLES